jgi:hypothetical protein
MLTPDIGQGPIPANKSRDVPSHPKLEKDLLSFRSWVIRAACPGLRSGEVGPAAPVALFCVIQPSKQGGRLEQSENRRVED